MAAQHAYDDRDRDPGESEQRVERAGTAPTQHSRGEKAEDDVMSDPALDDRVGSDWADEGGATPSGPATSTPGGVDTEESKRQVRIDRERGETGGGESDGEHHGDRREDETGSSAVTPGSPD